MSHVELCRIDFRFPLGPLRVTFTSLVDFKGDVIRRIFIRVRPSQIYSATEQKRCRTRSMSILNMHTCEKNLGTFIVRNLNGQQLDQLVLQHGVSQDDAIHAHL